MQRLQPNSATSAFLAQADATGDCTQTDLPSDSGLRTIGRPTAKTAWATSQTEHTGQQDSDQSILIQASPKQRVTNCLIN